MFLRSLLSISLLAIAISSASKPTGGIKSTGAYDIDWMKYFRRLNDYLVKRTKSRDPDVLLKVAEDVLEARNNVLFRSHNELNAIRTFIDFPSRVKQGECSLAVEAAAWKCEMGINDTDLSRDHELRPIELVVQEYGLQLAKNCPHIAGLRDLKFMFKRDAYGNVSMDLGRESQYKDYEYMMDFLENFMLDQNERKNPKGKITDAVAQIVKLKHIVSSGRCDDETESIFLRNNLATDFPTKSTARSLVSKLVLYYSEKYLANCKSTVLATFKETVQGFGTSLTEVISIAGHFSSINLGGKVTPIEMLRRKLLESENFDSLRTMSVAPDSKLRIRVSDRPKFRDIVKELASGRTDMSFVAELYRGDENFDFEKMNSVFHNLLVQPCEQFVNAFSSSFEPKIHTNLGEPMEDAELTKWVEFLFLRAAYPVCKFLVGQGQLGDSAIRWLHPYSL